MKNKPKYQLLQATGLDALLGGMLRQPELLSCVIPLMVLGTQPETWLPFEEGCPFLQQGTTMALI